MINKLKTMINNEPKERYKLYKAGKIWLVAGITFCSLVGSSLLTTNQAHADALKGTQTKLVANKTTNSNSNTKLEAVSSSATSQLKINTSTNDTDSSASANQNSSDSANQNSSDSANQNSSASANQNSSASANQNSSASSSMNTQANNIQQTHKKSSNLKSQASTLKSSIKRESTSSTSHSESNIASNTVNKEYNQSGMKNSINSYNSLVSTKASSAQTNAEDINNTGQNTRPYFNYGGAINLSQYSQSELDSLGKLVYGDGTTYGNTGMANAAVSHVYENGGNYLPNYVGSDGTLKIYNQSKFMTDEMFQTAANYWNKIAGKQLVILVNDPSKSDETMQDSYKINYDGSGNRVYTLGGQTYPNEWVGVDQKSPNKYVNAGNGIVFYPNDWSLSSFTDSQLINIKISVIIHELGHALGINHLNGGDTGNNYFDKAYSLDGVTSTKQQAAALALAGLTYQSPQRLASWVLTSPDSVVKTDLYKVSSTVYTGMQMDFGGNYVNDTTKQLVNNYKQISQNYNVTEITPQAGQGLSNGGITIAPMAGTTVQLNLVNKIVQVNSTYTSNHGCTYYRFSYDGHDYIMNSDAFNKAKQ